MSAMSDRLALSRLVGEAISDARSLRIPESDVPRFLVVRIVQCCDYETGEALRAVCPSLDPPLRKHS